jgi:hypothetical protein
MNPRNDLQLLLVLTFLSCNNPVTTTLERRQDTVLMGIDSAEKKVNIDTVNFGPDVNFETFLRHFNKDSLFQVNRISFPLKIMEVDASRNFELRERVIQKGELLKLDFSYDEKKINREYEQTIKVENDKAVIEVRGIENGILADYHFEKRKGKWILVTWNDSST